MTEVLNLVRLPAFPSSPYHFLHCARNDCCTDLRAMEYDGIIEKVYPLHENSAKKKIIDNYVKNRNPFTPMPLDDIRKYFGEEISFYFAWLGRSTPYHFPSFY